MAYFSYFSSAIYFDFLQTCFEPSGNGLYKINEDGDTKLGIIRWSTYLNRISKAKLDKELAQNPHSTKSFKDERERGGGD